MSSLRLAACLYAAMGVGYAGGVGMFPPAVLQVAGPRAYPIALGLGNTLEGLVSAGGGILTGRGLCVGVVLVCRCVCVCVCSLQPIPRKLLKSSSSYLASDMHMHHMLIILTLRQV